MESYLVDLLRQHADHVLTDLELLLEEITAQAAVKKSGANQSHQPLRQCLKTARGDTHLSVPRCLRMFAFANAFSHSKCFKLFCTASTLSFL